MGGKNFPEGIGIVKWNGQGQPGELGGHASRLRQGEGGHARTGLDQQRVHVAVIAPDELDQQRSACESPRQADGAHRRFGSGIDQPDLLNGGNGIADEPGQIDFGLGRRAETGPALERVADRPLDGGVRMAQDVRPPASDVVNVTVPVRVGDL